MVILDQGRSGYQVNPRQHIHPLSLVTDGYFISSSTLRAMNPTRQEANRIPWIGFSMCSQTFQKIRTQVFDFRNRSSGHEIRYELLGLARTVSGITGSRATTLTPSSPRRVQSLLALNSCITAGSSLTAFWSFRPSHITPDSFVKTSSTLEVFVFPHLRNVGARLMGVTCASSLTYNAQQLSTFGLTSSDRKGRRIILSRCSMAIRGSEDGNYSRL